MKTRSASASDAPRKVVSPERSLVLPPVFDTDKVEALSVQVETVRHNGVCTMDLIKSLVGTLLFPQEYTVHSPLPQQHG